jgi:phosphoglycolate phosphatase
MPSDKHRAVLFDLDGTLLDTLMDLADSMNQVLAYLQYPTHPTDMYKTFIGSGLEMLVRRALPEEHRDDQTIQHCAKQMRRVYDKRWDQKTRPYPRVRQLLHSLTRKGIHMAILSNKPHEPTCKMVEKFLGRWRFEPVVGAQSGVPKKPDPAVALAIADHVGIPAKQWLYLGDSGIDMQTARGANMTAVGALWGFKPAEELLHHGAQHLINAPDELLTLL